MKTKEMIEFCENILKSKRFVWANYEYEAFNKIISLLQQGEIDKRLLKRGRIRNKVLEARIKGLKDVLKKTENIIRRKYNKAP